MKTIKYYGRDYKILECRCDGERGDTQGISILAVHHENSIYQILSIRAIAYSGEGLGVDYNADHIILSEDSILDILSTRKKPLAATSDQE